MQAVLRAPGVVAKLRRLSLETREPIDLLDITDQVAEIVRASGVRDGLVSIFTKHTTAAIRVQEDEPLLIEDLKEFLARIAPRGDHYRHNDFRVRTTHMHEDESPNGSSHCLQLLLGASESVPVADGELQLGTWQRVFLVELDGPRPGNGPARDVLVQVLGSSD